MNKGERLIVSTGIHGTILLMHVGGFRNVIQDRINKGILKFPDKNEVMAIDEDPFPHVASINTASFHLRALVESKKAGKPSPGKVWVPKYYLVRVDRLKKELTAVCIDPLSRRNSVKRINRGTNQYNQFSKERKFSPKGKSNSPEDEFVPLREEGVERTTSPWGRFTAPRENDTGRFR